MRIELLDRRHATALTGFLKNHLHSSLFICSNLQRKGVRYDGAAFSGEYFGLVSDDETTVYGVLVHYWNGKLLMQCPDTEHLSWLCDFFVSYCERAVDGLIGPTEQAELCIEALGLGSRDFSVRRAETLMSMAMTDLAPAYSTLCDGFELALPSIERVNVLTQWLLDYEIEAFGAAMNKRLQASVDERVQKYLNGREGWFLLKEQNPVAFSGFNASASGMVQVGPVWTPREYRNCGYARRVVSGTLKIMHGQGYSDAVLFTDSAAARQAYSAVGFNKIGDYTLAFLAQATRLPVAH
ncbi:MAG: GNAT family N-acetyltransferase [Granulosicoccaceae bacterium]